MRYSSLELGAVSGVAWSGAELSGTWMLEATGRGSRAGSERELQ